MRILKSFLTPAGLMLLLCACGAPTAQEPAASHASAAGMGTEKLTQLRDEFIRTCTESATKEDNSANQEKFAQLCRCTFEGTAKQYGSEAAWLQALSDYDSGKNDGDGLEAKIKTSADQCAARL